MVRIKRSALRHLPKMAVDCWKILAISGSMEMTLLPSRATFWFLLFTCWVIHAWKGSPMSV